MPSERAYKKLTLSELQNYTGSFVSISAFPIRMGFLNCFHFLTGIFVNSAGQLDEIRGGYDGG